MAAVDGITVAMERAGKVPQTVKHVLNLLKRLLNFALRGGLLESLPRAARAIKMPRVDNASTENMTFEEARRLLRALDEESNQANAAVIRLALFTGMRKGAILHLQWTDLDFERGFIVLRGQTAKKSKTEIIPMNAQARQVLESLPRVSDTWLFPGRDGKRPLANVGPMARRVRKKAGLPDSFRPLHGLRHSFASWLASSGKVSMYELQKLLTHSSPQMTQRYAHLHDAALRAASEVAGELFGAAAADKPEKRKKK